MKTLELILAAIVITAIIMYCLSMSGLIGLIIGTIFIGIFVKKM